MHTEQRARFNEAGEKCGFSGYTEPLFDLFVAAETPLLARIAELERQLANREPFVVKLPLSISVLISDGLRADFMLNSEVKAATTAAGGTVL